MDWPISAADLKYVILATAAGWGYGIIFQRTGSIDASIMTHFGLNTTHFIFFTYPALATVLS
ncbi:putative CAAX protease family protein [Desulfosarcina variabilis str. Montpellier]|uniref:CPBP family glutamic-type intramembrane protease n=1 Tax=Desulfosarcina variabilis TaxID=2300 RepID=UPI003AFA124B